MAIPRRKLEFRDHLGAVRLNSFHHR
jgi:hypothetical protein